MTKRFILFCLLTAGAFFSNAHELSTAYINAQINSEGQVNGEIRLNLTESKDQLALDANADGQLTWHEIISSSEQIQLFISQGLHLSRGNKNCATELSAPFGLQEITGLKYLVLGFESTCQASGSISVKYDLFFDDYLNHKVIVNAKTAFSEHLAVIDKNNKELVIPISQDKYASNAFEVNAAWSTFFDFLYQGVYHILIGADHILFLLILLLTVCLYRKEHQWYTEKNASTVFKRAFWIVSSFTLAHSITLSGTALGFIPSFGSWIEVVIAVSILITAINIVYPFTRHVVTLSFGFGLIHGMGFAGALGDLGISQSSKLVSVLAFNLGVELGQLALLILFIPILFWLSAKKWFVTLVLPSTSGLISIVALYWIVVRL